MPQSQYYCSLDTCKEWLKTEIPADDVLSEDDKRLLQAIRVVSRRVDNTFASLRPLFQPFRETYKQALAGASIHSALGTFRLDRWLLAFDGSVSVSGAAVNVEGYPDPDMPPFRQIHLTDAGASWYGICPANSAPPQVSVPGIFGFHREGPGAFEAVDALAAQMLMGASTLTVADADGADQSGMTPRISPGDLLRIGDEYLEVVSANRTTNVITARRAVNGTDAAQHEIGDVVYRWNIEEPVKVAVARQAALMYARRGAYTTMEVVGMTEVRYPSDWLHEVMGMLQGYA